MERVLVILNFILFVISFQCAEVDSDVSNAMIYIMYAVAYFVITTTFLSGAASFRSLFKSDGSRWTSDKSSSALSSDAHAKPTGLAGKKPSAKKPVVPLLKAEKKELQMNNFYQNAKRTR